MDVPIDPNHLPERSQLGKFLKPKQLITWKNGVPMPFNEWILPKEQINNVILAALALPYAGTIDPRNPEEILIEPEFDGLTNIEVAAIKTARKAASGDTEALKFTVERLLGKPKQEVAQTNVTVSLTEYLDRLDLETKAAEWDQKIVDVQSITPTEKAKWDI